MKQLLFGIGLGIVSAAFTQTVTVSGNVTLEGSEFHNAIKVKFAEQSPSAETDSTLTGMWGDFQIELYAGVYDVQYTNPGYDTVTVDNVGILADMVLDSVVLSVIVEDDFLIGALTGSLGPGIFRVGGNIGVPWGSELVIQPGTRLEYLGPYTFQVEGTLTAIGTSEDSIVFTAASPGFGWDGMLITSSDTTRLQFCEIEYANVNAVGAISGGGISIVSASPVIQNCRIHRCDGINGGGGVKMNYSNPIIRECVIESNYGYYGGGIRIGAGSAPIIENCVIRNNSAYQGGGIYVDFGSNNGSVDHCSIYGNNAELGGGLFCWGATGCEITYCPIYENTAERIGGGVYLAQTSAHLVHCSIWANSSSDYTGGIHAVAGEPSIINCAVGINSAFNGGNVYLESTLGEVRNTVILGGSPLPLYFGSSDDARVEYCSIYASETSAIAFHEGDPGHAPPFIGVKGLLNANGDSCDTYYNIFENPLFVDAANGNFHLQEDSPCIDAGDPSLPFDPDNTVADIGAFYYPQPEATRENNLPMPTDIVLHQNYPNPFNATTNIKFEIPGAGLVRLELFDVQGRLTSTLLDGRLDAGLHQISFNADGLPSGVYFYRLAVKDKSQIKKMILLK